MLYDYKCCNPKCGIVFEVDKAMSAPDPKSCPKCRKRKVERYFQPSTIPGVTYANRPPWTYNGAKGYKTAKHNDGPRIEINSNHGDLGSWHCDAKVVPEPPKGG